MILDTNAVSAMADGDPDLEPVLRLASRLALPVITLGEYRYGLRQSRNRAKYEGWLKALIERCSVLDVDGRTTEHYAEVRAELKTAGQPIPGNDVWIAALARQHALPILSRDRHFDFVPIVRRISW
ncbi:MAG TPA: type II toxin-antitoxin system VapC family toxin [Bryobacteraceae bacterium]